MFSQKSYLIFSWTPVFCKLQDYSLCGKLKIETGYLHFVFRKCTLDFSSIEHNSPFQNEVTNYPKQHKGQTQCKYVVGELAGIHRDFLQELVWVSVNNRLRYAVSVHVRKKITCNGSKRHRSPAVLGCRTALQHILPTRISSSWYMSPIWGSWASLSASLRSRRTSCRALRKLDRQTFRSVTV